MFKNNSKPIPCSALVRLSVVVSASTVFVVGIVAAQDSPLAAPPSAPGSSAIVFGKLSGGPSFPTVAGVANRWWQLSHVPAGEFAGTVRSGGIRRITLEQVKQQSSADRMISPLARLGQLSIEAAKQHRLGVQADYFPKLGATVANLHYSEFLGKIVSGRGFRLDPMTQRAVPLFSQNQTIAAVTFIQPITPLFQVYQAVQIARADERIAIAKAGGSVSKKARDTEIEEAYFKLLIAQRRLVTSEAKLKSTESKPLYASASIELVRASDRVPESVEAKKAILTAATEVKELTASLNRFMGWPEDTELQLVLPDPLVENISFEEVANKPPSANPDLVEAEQTVVKARAASVLSKLAYVPTVAAVGGYMFQNAIPLVPSNFGYGGVMVSYNIFDFGKRERAVKEARAQLGMAEIAVELTKAKIAGDLKKSYFELERTRQLSQLAQQMGSSVTRLMTVGFAPDTIEGKAALANVETQILEADLAHRQAYARLTALMGPQR